MFGILALLLVVSPLHFRHAPGWHVGSQSAHACAGVSASRCVQASGWASTVRYRDCPNCSPPHKTLAHLPLGLFQRLQVLLRLVQGRGVLGEGVAGQDEVGVGQVGDQGDQLA